MSGDRTVTLPPRLQAGKSAFSDLVSAFGGQEAASARTGKSQSRICAYGHKNMADFPPLDVVAELERDTVGLPGHPHVARWLARQTGHVLVALPTAKPDGHDLCKALGDCQREAGEASARVLEAFATNHEITADEIRQADIRGEVQQAIEAFVRLAAMLDAVLDQDR